MEKAQQAHPRIIWLLWLQGLDRAPRLVKKCIDSWKRQNPSWKIVVLDQISMRKYIDVDEIIIQNQDNITRQALSDIVRINLLNEYGGVWVDATCYCCRPLDGWLEEYMGAGFFAFRDPGVDRPISSWFLSSCPGSNLTSLYCELVNSYWSKGRFSNQNNGIGWLIKAFVHLPLKYGRSNSVLLRVSLAVMKYFKVYPYYWFHYLFADLIRRDRRARAEWDSVRTMSADIPHRLQHHGLLKPISELMKREIDKKVAPFYKLIWNNIERDLPVDCALAYLLNNLPE